MVQNMDEVKYQNEGGDVLTAHVTFVDSEHGTVDLSVNLDASGNKLSVAGASLVEGEEKVYQGGTVKEVPTTDTPVPTGDLAGPEQPAAPDEDEDEEV